MKAKGSFCVVLFLACALVPARALQASPQETLEEIASADKADTVLKHLPVKVEEYLAKLPAKERAALADKLLLSKNLEREGGKLTRSEDGGWVLIERTTREGKDGKEEPNKVVFTPKNTYTSGPDALVELEVTEHDIKSSILIGMHFEGGEWRIHRVGPWQNKDLEAELLHQGERSEPAPEADAALTLAMVSQAIATYIATYADQGCPATLQALSGREKQEAAPDHAMLLDADFLQEPLVKEGYEFHYLRVDKEHYQITANPVRWGEGARSLFTDETSMIHVTSESRPANASDPPLK